MSNFNGQDVGQISIKVVPNLDGFRAELRRELEAIEKSTRGEIKVDVDADTTGVREKIEEAARDTNATVHVDVDKRLADQLRQNLDKLATKKKVELDLDRSQFNRLLEETRALAKQADMKLDVGIKDAAAEAKLAHTIAKLKAMAAAADIKIDIDVDHNRISRAAEGAINGFRKSMFKGLSRVGNMLSDDTTLIAAAVLSIGAPLAGTITAGIAGLPALLSAIAVPAAAAAFGINGIKQALIDTGIAIEDEKDGLKLGPIFDGIKASISEVFSSGLTPVFTKLLDLLPTLEAGLKPVAQAMVDTAGAITDVVTSSRGLQITENVLGNVTKLGDALAPGWAKATEAIMELADRGSNHLKGLGDWFTALMDRVKNAVDSVISSGAFDKAISGLKPILQGLANAIGNVFSTAFDWISNPANSQRFGDFIEQLGSLVKGALKISEVIFPILERLGEYIGTLVDQFSASGTVDLTGLLNQVMTDISNSAPWQALGVKFGEGLLHGILGVLRNAFTGDWLMSIIPFISPMAWVDKLLGGDAGGQAIGSQVASSILQGIKGMFGAGALFNMIPWNEMIQGAQMAFQMLTSAVSSGMQSAVQTVVSKAGEIISEVGSWPSRIVGALGDLGGLLVAAGQSLMQGLLNGIKAGFESVKSFVSGIAGWIADHKGPLPYDRQVLVDNGMALMEGLGTGLERGFQGVLEQTKGLAARIQEAIDSGLIATNLGPFKQQYQQQIDALQLQRQQLQMQMEGTSDPAQKKALRDQLSQLANARELLQTQSQQLRLNDRYGEGLVDQNQLMTDMLGKMAQAGQAFGMANAQQMMSDLGISGQGAVPQLANIGLGFASQMVGQLLKGGMGGGTTIQVNSADEAFATYQRVNNQQALKHNRR